LKGEGYRSRNGTGKWQVEHKGPCNAPRASSAPAQQEPQKPKANTYGGDCANCGKYVVAEQGRIVKVDGRWKAAHLDRAACDAAATPVVQQAAPQGDRPARKVYAIPTGYYAVPSRTGSNDLDFFYVKSPTKGKWVTYSFVERVIGGQGRTPISRQEQTVALDTIEFATPELAGKAYADAIGCCYKCNLTLTDDESRARGTGPVCARKAQKLAVAA
jgi:hypothetical protein